MTVYAMTGTVFETVAGAGGCEEGHYPQPDATGRPAITCAVCEPLILAKNMGYAHDPGKVALTPDERAGQENAERDAIRQQQMLWSGGPAVFGQMLAEAFRSIGAIPPAAAAQSASVAQLSALASLSEQEWAIVEALRGKRAANEPDLAVTTTPASAETGSIGAAEVMTAQPTAAAVATVRRGPRKTTTTRVAA